MTHHFDSIKPRIIWEIIYLANLPNSKKYLISFKQFLTREASSRKMADLFQRFKSCALIPSGYSQLCPRKEPFGEKFGLNHKKTCLRYFC